ncbi:HEPN domain-containing protein [Candidatus Woesearchaeota archaeon]|nr:HEPN domain-containing protein [Candidatus Woesearchaeota archaeon]
MDFEHKIYLTRAENELNLSLIIMKISDDKDMQVSTLGMREDTYYSATISHAYYCIFYAAKAYLLLKGIKTEAPEEHRKTLEQFSKLVDNGTIDVELLKIYQNLFLKADTLLHIFELEKGKRGKFTYKRLAQANKEPAQESIKNAQFFFKQIYELCEKINSL